MKSMSKKKKKDENNILKDINAMLGIDDAFLAPDALLKILFDREKREKLFDQMREYFNYDLSYDWFHEYFQKEHADRKNNKQDFTPNCLGKLMNEILDPGGGSFHEAACGTGGLVIQTWNSIRLKTTPWEYDASSVFFELEELSDRTIPFLLLNLMIRGINASVVHGDSLTREAKGAFFIQNFDNEALGYSDLNVLPYNEITEKLLNIKFTKNHYPSHVERSHVDIITKEA